MQAREREVCDLGKAEADILAGERRIAAQIARIATLKADGHDTHEAEKVLATFQATLAEWVAHRHTILARIARMNGEDAL